jgi:hypothetical protein
VISPTQRPLPDNTQHSEETDIRIFGGIRTHNPSKRTAADLRLRPRGLWDRLTPCYFFFQWLDSPLRASAASFFKVSRSHFLDTPHSVGLLWTRNQLVAETSTWQHTTLTRDRHPCPGAIRTHSPSKRTAADPRLRPRGRWDRLTPCFRANLVIFLLFRPV